MSASSGRNRWNWLTAAVLVAGAAGVAALLLVPEAPEAERSAQPPLAEFARVEAASEGVVLGAEGFVRAAEEIDLVSEVEGRIVRIADDLGAGARFEAGALLVEIDPALFEAEVRDAEAELASARADLERTRNQVERIEALEQDELAAGEELERVRVEETAAAARVDRAEASRDRARLRLADTRLRAPFASEVTEESAAVGRYLRPGDAVARIAAVDGAEVEIGLDPEQAALVEGLTRGIVGLPARVVAKGDEAFEGVVDRVRPRLDPQARTLDLVVRIDGAFEARGDRGRLRLDEFVEVELTVPAEDGWWRLPATALKSPGRIWRLGEGDALEAVDVEIVLRAPDRVIVRGEGLAAGDRVLLTDLTAPARGLQVRPLGDVREDETDGGRAP